MLPAWLSNPDDEVEEHEDDKFNDNLSPMFAIVKNYFFNDMSDTNENQSPVKADATEQQEAEHEDGNGADGDQKASGGSGNGGNGNAAVDRNQDEPEQFRKLFIGGLSLNTDDQGLRDFYSQYGSIVDCVVMRDGMTKKSRGFGFVTYTSKTEVDEAMSHRPHTIDQKTVDPKRAVPREQSSRGEANVSTMRLYVSGVREEHTEEMFRDYFGDYGGVVKTEIITDKQTNKPRGFGFITFDDYDAVDKCVLIKSHQIGGYRCDVKKALSRDEMSRAQQMDRDRAERGQRSRGSRGGAVWQGSNRSGGPGGAFREPHGGGGGGGGGYGGPWNAPPPQSGWGGPAQGQAQWGGYGQVNNYSGYSGYSGNGGGGGGGAWGGPAAVDGAWGASGAQAGAQGAWASSGGGPPGAWANTGATYGQPGAYGQQPGAWSAATGSAPAKK